MEEKNSSSKTRIRLEPKIRTKHNKVQQFLNDNEDLQIKSFDVERFIKKNTIRLIASIIIFALVFSIKSLPFTFARNMSRGIGWAINHQMDWKEDIVNRKSIIPVMSGQIEKFLGVDEIPIGKKPNNEKYISPVEGKVISPFGDSLHPVFKTKIEGRGIEIETEPSEVVKSISDGKVVQIQNSLYGGKRVVIQHDDNIKGVYEGFSNDTLSLNQEVSRGENIGEMKGGLEGEDTVFYFELWKEDKAVDPLEYIELEVGTEN